MGRAAETKRKGDDGARRPARVAVLPPELANQIAAGEVVERPASVVKELVENALDAGASRIEITIENGGRDLIRVADDGSGMRRDDALRALERHATSKITCVDDLFRIGTLGFRGEAIPSIGSVSLMTISTKVRDAIEGTRVVVRGGVVETIAEVGVPAGTSVQVEELFFNTPARLKFLKTPATESRHITEMITRVSLSRPDVRFLLHRDGRVRLDLAPASSVKERAIDLLGREVYDVLFETYPYPAVNGVSARGFYSKPSHRQRTPHNMYAFVNGRYVADSTVRAAIRGAYGTLLEKGRYPSVLLFLDVPVELVDVNVHPAKHEVRFHDTNSVYRAVYHAIADALAQAPWVERESRTYALRRREAGGYEPASGAPAPVAEPERGRIVTPEMAPLRALGASDKPLQRGFRAEGASPLVDPPPPRPAEPVAPAPAPAGLGPQPEPEAIEEADEGAYFSSLRVIGQLKRQYIVCEDASAMVVIDQHAAHERIGFERLKALFENEHKELQPLLFPKRLELDAVRAEVLASNLSFFESAGFELEHFGGSSYVLKSVPAIFAKANIDRIVRETIDDLAYHGRSDRVAEALDALLSRMACHSVVRGPTPLTVPECEALLRQMDTIDFAANCPHGRPVYWRVPLADLEASFDRR